jgi:hypothetical protein
LFTIKQRRNLLKAGMVGDGDNFGRRMQSWGNGGPFSPLNDLIRGQAQRGRRDQ